MSDTDKTVHDNFDTASDAPVAPATGRGAAITNELPRQLSLLAGLAGMVVAAIRFLSGAGEIEAIRIALINSQRAPIVTIVWHSLTIIFFLGGLMTLLSAWRSPPYARATALFNTMVFATVAVVMATVAAGSVSSATAFWPIFPLTIVALLSLAAWWKA